MMGIAALALSPTTIGLRIHPSSSPQKLLLLWQRADHLLSLPPMLRSAILTAQFECTRDRSGVSNVLEADRLAG